MEGLISNPFTVRDVGHAVVRILRELPGLVVQTVRLAKALNAMKVDRVPHHVSVSPLNFQEMIKMIQLLLQDDEEKTAIGGSLKRRERGRLVKESQ